MLKLRLQHCAVLSRSVVSDSVTPWTAACQAPLPMGFSRPEHWSGVPCPAPGGLPKAGLEPRPPALQADSLPAELPGTPIMDNYHYEQCHSEYLCPSVVPRLFNYLLRVTFRSAFNEFKATLVEF